MKNCTIIPHQGWADFFSLNSIFNIYSKKFDKIKIFVSDNQRKIFLKNCLFHLKNIDIEIPCLTNYQNCSKQTCIKCHTYGCASICPRQIGACEYIDYTKYENYQEHIKIGAFNNYNEWERHRNSSISFSHAFYTYQDIDLYERISNFKIYHDKQKDLNLNTDYIVCHEDLERNIFLKKDKLLKNIPIYNLDKKSNFLIDQIKILEESKEIHMIDSSYSVLVYYLSFHNDKIKNIPKFLHTRPDRDIKIYENPTPKNWMVI